MLLLRPTINYATNILALKSGRTLGLAARYLSINVAIVGSGPAGFYTAQKLLKNPDINVDIYEKLPVPFGLIRYGVAPDHRDVKNVINSFTSTIENNRDRLNFYGNVSFGTDIILDNLIEAYHAVVLCYGSAQDKLLNIEGENSKNTISARRFVGWYNGSPQDKDLEIDLNCDTACIIGHGNVAIDCARILLQPTNIDKTDITSYAQQALARSKVKRIFIIGRRGPVQVSFTIKELRELVKLNGKSTSLEPATVFEDVGVSSTSLKRLERSRMRILQLLLEVASTGQVNSPVNSNDLELIIKFLAKPVRIKSDPTTNKVTGLELQRMFYDCNETFLDRNARPNSTDKFESIDCGLIIRSLGYKAVMVDKNLPLNTELGAILNEDGRVFGHRNLYCSGWLATGASGVIAGTLNSSQVTTQSILDDISQKELPNLSRKKPGYKLIREILESKSIQVVHFNDWLRIDDLERRIGATMGKDREKIVDVDQMLKVARGDNATPV